MANVTPTDKYPFKLRCPRCGWVDSYATAAERDAAYQRHWDRADNWHHERAE